MRRAAGAFALYGGLVLLLEDGASEIIRPLGPRGRARTSPEGDFGHQIEHAGRPPPALTRGS